MWWDTIYTVVQINGQVLVVDVVVEKNVMIQAADGILQATDIYRPANQGVSGEKAISRPPSSYSL